MRVDIHFHHHFYSEPGADVAGSIRENVMAVSAEIQKILDQARQSSSLVQSVHLGMQGLQQQVADMKAKIDSMPAGNVLSDEDKAALQEAAGQLDNTINMLKSDIPANVDKSAEAGNQQALDPNGQRATGETPQPAQQSQADQTSGSQGSDGSASAKPLPGTGQS